MINLTDTKYGTKRKAIIGGINSFDIFNKSINIVFYIQLIDNQGNLLDDLSLNQNRRAVYQVNTLKWVDNQFNEVPEGANGAVTEYDYFWNRLQSVLLPTLVLQLGNKLKERGFFE